MATKSPTQFHNHWGEVVSTAELPNVLGATIQDGALEIGDLAYVTADGTYHCTNATPGAAIWEKTGPTALAPSSYDWSSDYSYTQVAVPIEETIGYGMLDGSQVQGAAYFQSTFNPQFTGAGTASVRLYDLGPAAGPPAAPVLVATLSTTSSGIQYKEQALAVGGAPGVNQIQNSARMYEMTVYQSSVVADTVYVGSAGIVDK